MKTRKNTMKEKMIAIILTIAMVLAFMPTAAFADDGSEGGSEPAKTESVSENHSSGGSSSGSSGGSHSSGGSSSSNSGSSSSSGSQGSAGRQTGVVTADSQEQSKTLTERLKELGETDANHEIVIEPGAGPVLSEKQQKKEIEEAIRRQEELQASGQKPDTKPPKAKLATDYVIDNVIHTAVEVSRKERKEE